MTFCMKGKASSAVKYETLCCALLMHWGAAIFNLFSSNNQCKEGNFEIAISGTLCASMHRNLLFALTTAESDTKFPIIGSAVADFMVSTFAVSSLETVCNSTLP